MMKDTIYNYKAREHFLEKYTPFSGTLKGEQEAITFIKRNGEFWLNRGIILLLFINSSVLSTPIRRKEDIQIDIDILENLYLTKQTYEKQNEQELRNENGDN